MKEIKIGKDAALELEEAAVWYEQVQQGLGEQFLSAFTHAIQLLGEENPPLIPVQGHAASLGARKLIIHKFPFSLIVFEMDQDIVVVALAHHSRTPGYWKSRTKEFIPDNHTLKSK